MSDNSLIWTKSQCLKAFDDLLIKIALSSFAELEGRELLKENDRLKTEPEFQLPPQHEKMIENAVKKHERKKNLVLVRKAASKIVTRVAVVFLTLAIGFGTTMTASAEFRQAVYNLILTQSERYTQIKIDREYTAFVNSEIYTWENAFAPTMMPQGYAVSDVIDAGAAHIVIYINDDGRNIEFVQDDGTSDGSMQVDTENAQLVQNIYINESEGLLVSKNGLNTLVWRIGDSMLSLTSNEDTETLMAIARGIKLLN